MENISSYWRRCALVACAYSLIYVTLRSLSAGPHVLSWIPVAGVRFACLLFIPVRFWPALIVGEALPLAFINYQCVDQFGWRWFAATTLPHMLCAAPVVYVFRKTVPQLNALMPQKMGGLLLTVFLVALVSAVHGALNYSLVTAIPSNEQAIPVWLYGSRLLTGSYLSILAIVPAVLWVDRLRGGAWRQLLRVDFWVSRLRSQQIRGTVGLLVATFILTSMVPHVDSGPQYWLLCGVLSALAFAAWRYGWRSVAVVGCGANLAGIASMITRDDTAIIQLQCVIALCMTVLLMFGARTTLARQFAELAQSARRIARVELFAMERHRLAYACVLDEVYDDTRKEATRILSAARRTLAHDTVSEHYQRFDSLHQEHMRLTAGMSPPVWWQFGGGGGPIAESLTRAGIRCEIAELPAGSQLLSLSTEYLMAMYRISCEALLYLLRNAATDHIRLNMSVHNCGGASTVTSTLESVGDPIQDGNAEDDGYANERLELSLGASGLDEAAMRWRAHLYGGGIQLESISDGKLRIVAWVTDVSRG